MKCDFSYKHYREILSISKAAGYKIMGCFDYLKIKRECPQKVIVMRHDVDYFPERALDIARIESQEGAKSTYFFRVFNNQYNIFGYETLSIIKEIESLGHEIGYHAEPVDIAECLGISHMEAFKMGKSALELALGHPVLGAASHREATGYNNLHQFIAHKHPSDLGLEYEAYDQVCLDLFNNSTYITDGYEWYWRVYRKGVITETRECLCNVANTSEEDLIYCLTHPNSWYKRHYHVVNSDV